MSTMKMARQMKGLTQDQISVLADVPQPILSKIERGVIKPTPSIREAQRRIAMALECSVEILFAGQDDRP
jgi:DNA-binding XRE family transcriptional regulator